MQKQFKKNIKLTRFIHSKTTCPVIMKLRYFYGSKFSSARNEEKDSLTKTTLYG